jgi:hypothetical protein
MRFFNPSTHENHYVHYIYNIIILLPSSHKFCSSGVEFFPKKFAYIGTVMVDYHIMRDQCSSFFFSHFLFFLKKKRKRPLHTEKNWLRCCQAATHTRGLHSRFLSPSRPFHLRYPHNLHGCTTASAGHLYKGIFIIFQLHWSPCSGAVWLLSIGHL